MMTALLHHQLPKSGERGECALFCQIRQFSTHCPIIAMLQWWLANQKTKARLVKQPRENSALGLLTSTPPRALALVGETEKCSVESFSARDDRMIEFVSL
jgi:hypothetical protein